MQCPKCNSENTQRLSVIYQSGTQHISTTSRTYGGGGGTGFMGAGAANTYTSGTSQSYLAGKAAPPGKKKLANGISIIVIGALLFYIQFLLALIVIAVGVFLALKAYRYNQNVYPGLYSEWRKTWHCNKCGSLYLES